MPRKRQLLSFLVAQKAPPYLAGALDRRAPVFSKDIGEAEKAFDALCVELKELKGERYAALVNAWLDEHLTPDGRKRMLAALRRQRTNENAALKSKPVRLSARTYNDLKELADKLDVKMQTALYCSVQVLLADRTLQSRAKKPALAMQLRSAPQPASAEASDAIAEEREGGDLASPE